MTPFTPTFALFDMLGTSEVALVFLIILLLFGGDKMPEFARGFAKVVREFRKAANGLQQEFNRALEEDEAQKAKASSANQPHPSIMPPPAVTTPYSYDEAPPPETDIAAVAPAPADPSAANQPKQDAGARPETPPSPDTQPPAPRP